MRNRLPHTLLHVLPFAALFALACAFLAPAAPTSARRTPRAPQDTERRKEQEPPSNTTVYGRAVYDDTNRPIRRARVMLVDETGSRPEFTALTDSDGAFRIEHVREGSYFAFVDTPGVLSPIGFLDFTALRGRPDFSEARKFFDAVDVNGKEDFHLNIRARRGATLGGKVTYADGDPAVNVSVNVMRRDANGRLEKLVTGINIISLSGLKTDDRGIFRVSGLPPGEYILSVSEAADHGSGGDDVSGRDPMMGVLEGLSRQQLLMTFYPSVTSAKEAAVIKADAGVERSDLDIVIPDRPLHIVGGVVRGKRDKRPIKNAKISIVRRDENAGVELNADSFSSESYTMSTVAVTDAEGHWEFKDIPEGPYTLIIKPAAESEEVPVDVAPQVVSDTDNANISYARNMNGSSYRRTRRKNGYTPGRRDVQVIDSDLTDINVELNDGGRVTGVITSEDAKMETYGSVILRRFPDGSEATGSEDSWTTYVSDGQFELAGLPAGKYSIQFSSYTERGRGYAKSVTWNGKDLLHEPLEVVEGASIDGVRIVMSKSQSKLRVRVSSAGRKSASGVAVFLVPANDAGGLEWQQFACATEEDGTCEIDAPPGDYRVVALPSLSGGINSLDAEMKRRALTSPRITLTPNETKEFEVTVPEK